MGNGDGRDLHKAALRDPLRSSEGMHEASRFQRGIAEFLRMPLLITAAFCAAGVLVSVLDATSAGQQEFRVLAENLVPGGGAREALTSSAERLMPKPSDEPEAAAPQRSLS